MCCILNLKVTGWHLKDRALGRWLCHVGPAVTDPHRVIGYWVIIKEGSILKVTSLSFSPSPLPGLFSLLHIVITTMTSGSSKKTLTKCQQTPAPPGLLNLHNCELGLTSLLNKFTGHKHFVIAIEGAQYGSFFHYKITHNSNVAFLEKKTNSQKKKKTTVKRV